MVSDDEPPQRRDRPATIPPTPGERAQSNGEPGPPGPPGSPGSHDELPETIRHRLERLVPEMPLWPRVLEYRTADSAAGRALAWRGFSDLERI